MIEVIWATPLYEFLRQCNVSSLAKKVLDCGAAGEYPTSAMARIINSNIIRMFFVSSISTFDV